MKHLFLLVFSVICIHAFLIANIIAGNVYVANTGDNGNSGESWGQAVATIQQGVRLASAGDTVWVSNGIYSSDGSIAPERQLTNRVYIFKTLNLRSVNGPDYTWITGQYNPLGRSAVRGIYVEDGYPVVIDGFTLNNCGTHSYESEGSGGGIYASGQTLITNCNFKNCRAAWNGGGVYTASATPPSIYDSYFKSCQSINSGGGASDCMAIRCFFSKCSSTNGGAIAGGSAYSCIMSNNTANQFGGGACGTKVYNSLLCYNISYDGGGGGASGSFNGCTIVSNKASIGAWGGGLFLADAVNCIIWGNSGTNAANMDSITFSCVENGAEHGVDGCFTNNPKFATDGFTLQIGSPCLNAGSTTDAFTQYGDLLGQPRVIGSAVDMGAYESSFIPSLCGPLTILLEE